MIKIWLGVFISRFLTVPNDEVADDSAVSIINIIRHMKQSNSHLLRFPIQTFLVKNSEKLYVLTNFREVLLSSCLCS
ncbi:hypothetical protein M5689_019581 [Euphorbia peplus]|nr:hypothetical protein M5689_019581 [Euphorbia peplus]